MALRFKNIDRHTPMLLPPDLRECKWNGGDRPIVASPRAGRGPPARKSLFTVSDRKRAERRTVPGSEAF